MMSAFGRKKALILPGPWAQLGLRPEDNEVVHFGEDFGLDDYEVAQMQYLHRR